MRIYDDLPVQYRDNINRDVPFANQKPGAKPVLNVREIDDVVAFMRTLTDGFIPTHPYGEARQRTMSNDSRVTPLVSDENKAPARVY